MNKRVTIMAASLLAVMMLGIVVNPALAKSNPPLDFTISPTSQLIVISQGLSGNLEFKIRALRGFGTVNTWIEGFPNIDAFYSNQNPVQPNSDARVIIWTNPDATPGIYHFTFHASSGAVDHTASVTMIIKPATSNDKNPFNYIVTPTKTTLYIRQGLSGSLDFRVIGLKGYGTVYFGMEGFPDIYGGAACESYVQPGHDTVLIAWINSDATPGTYPFILHCISGSTDHPVAIKLVILPSCVS